MTRKQWRDIPPGHLLRDAPYCGCGGTISAGEACRCLEIRTWVLGGRRGVPPRNVLGFYYYHSDCESKGKEERNGNS